MVSAQHTEALAPTGYCKSFFALGKPRFASSDEGALSAELLPRLWLDYVRGHGKVMDVALLRLSGVAAKERGLVLHDKRSFYCRGQPENRRRS